MKQIVFSVIVTLLSLTALAQSQESYNEVYSSFIVLERKYDSWEVVETKNVRSVMVFNYNGTDHKLYVNGELLTELSAITCCKESYSNAGVHYYHGEYIDTKGYEITLLKFDNGEVGLIFDDNTGLYFSK